MLEEPTDRPYRIREFTVRDPNGVEIVFGQDVDSRRAFLECAPPGEPPEPPAAGVGRGERSRVAAAPPRWHPVAREPPPDAVVRSAAGDGCMPRRALLDLLLRPVVPRPDATFVPPPRELGPGIWALERRVRLAGLSLPSRSLAIALAPKQLLLLSPPADACEGLDRLGAVSAIVAPNSFHHLHLAEHARRQPAAGIFVAPELPRRVPGLPAAAELTADLAVAWRERLPYVVLGPHRGISEVLFFHPASRALILTDLACNLVDLPRAWERAAWRLSGMPAGFGPNRNARSLLLRDRAGARQALRAVQRWPFERIVPAHGAIVERDARAAFDAAFARYL